MKKLWTILVLAATGILGLLFKNSQRSQSKEQIKIQKETQALSQEAVKLRTDLAQVKVRRENVQKSIDDYVAKYGTEPIKRPGKNPGNN